MKTKKLLGYINVEDLKQLERIKQDLFDDLGPVRNTKYYFIGELGEENEIKHMSGAQKREYYQNLKKTQVEMEHEQKKFFPAKRNQSILLKEKEAIMDSE